MLESFLQMFTNPGPASFINFTFLPKYTFYFVQGVKYTLMLSCCGGAAGRESPPFCWP